MPAKITNYLTQGLPSRIYLECYLKPTTGYALANKIYGKPTVAKIYTWAKEMIEKGYLEKTKEDGYRSLAEPLADVIRQILEEQEVTLDHNEKNLLVSFLGSSSFRQIASEHYGGLTEEERANSDIVSFVIEVLSFISALSFNAKQLQEIPDISIKEALSLITNEKESTRRQASVEAAQANSSAFNQAMKRYFTRAGLKEEARNFDLSTQISRYAPFSVFEELPCSFLYKLSKLTQIGDYVTYIFALSYSLQELKSKEEKARKITEQEKQDDLMEKKE